MMMITSVIIAARPEVFYPDNRKHMIIQGAVLNAVSTLFASIFSLGFWVLVLGWKGRDFCEDLENVRNAIYECYLHHQQLGLL